MVLKANIYYISTRFICQNAEIASRIDFRRLSSDKILNLLCVFSDVFSHLLHKRMHMHSDWICFAFCHCVFSNVFLSQLIVGRQTAKSHWLKIAFLRCAFLNGFSTILPHKVTLISFVCTWSAFLHCVWPHVFSNGLYGLM